jgi:RecB family exonuclease
MSSGRAGRDVLVVARSATTAAALERELAGDPSQHAGWPGLRVATLATLLDEALPGRLALAEPVRATPPMPPDHVWAQQLAARPVLRDRLAAWLDRVHAMAALGECVALPGPLAELRNAGWGRGDLERTVARLAAHPPAGEVHAVGFEGEAFSYCGQVGNLERALLEKLAARFVEPHGSPTESDELAPPIQCLRLADVHAEARAVAMIAQGAEDVLVLVADDATCARVRAALVRNGVPAADDEGSSVARHALVAALRPLVPVFETKGAAVLDVDDLERLLASPVVRRCPRLGKGPDDERAPGQASAIESGSRTALIQEDEPPEPATDDGGTSDEPRLSRRRLREMLVVAGRRRLTVTQWAKLLHEVAGRWEREASSDAAKAMEEGTGPDAAAKAASAARLGTARLASEVAQELARATEEGTFRALKAFASKLAPRGGGADALGLAVISALARGGGQPVTAAAFDQLVNGRVRAGHLDGGVRVLGYDDYDGRGAATLILCDVHDAGLGRVPAPDPFLSEADLARLGVASGARAVQERIALARWAARRAGRAVALASATDASGRAVSLPVDLARHLALRCDLEHASHGLGLAPDGSLASHVPPEQRDLGAYVEVGASRDTTSVQIDAEWVRAGSIVRQPAAPSSHGASAPGAASKGDPAELPLADLLAGASGIPSEVAPYLGIAGADAGLPEGFVLSASRLERLVQCMYKAFASLVLRLEARDEVAEEPDARERGTTMHALMEAALPGHRLVVPAAELDKARLDLEAALTSATDARCAPTSTGSNALGAARDGEAERRKAHWRRWVRTRVRTVDEVNKDVLAAFWKRPDVRRALDAATKAVTRETNNKSFAGRVETGLKALVRARGEEPGSMLEDPAPLIDALLSTTRKGQTENPERVAVREQLGTDSVRSAVEALGGHFRATALPLLPSPLGDDRVIAAEVPIGGADGSAGTMKLGDHGLVVRGRIDALVLHEGPTVGKRGWIVLDHKTKTSPTEQDALTSFVSPQLAFYALAVGQGLAQPKDDPHRARLPVVGVCADPTSQADKELVRWPFVPEDADRATRAFSALLDRAKEGAFPLWPHPSSCRLESRAYCDFAEMCRRRAHAFATLPETEGAEQP